MANIPANTKLWNMLIAQAKTRFRVWPSAAASAWVHQHYVQLGGKFVESTKDMSRKDRAERLKDEHEKEKQKEKEKGGK